MIVLLSYSTSWSRNEYIHSFTGEVVSPDDSVMISIDDLRVANAKMIVLEYEKQINDNLRQIIYNDSCVIDALTNRIRVADTQHDKAIKELKKEKKIACGISITSILLLILSLL